VASDDHPTTDWATLLTHRLDGLVGIIRDRSVRPATKIVRYAVVGLLGALVGLAVIIVMIVGVVHLFDTAVFKGRVFFTDFLFGGILLLSGAFLLRASAKAGRPS
jgi:hypothetical protein